ncbi:hypothetical protein FACS189491_07220 [Spirochaetia bacterium]|nr:hypothetical protein FACS189491_07220 [Spirochaetia bacterium]
MDTHLIPITGILLYPFLLNLIPLVTANAAAWGIAPAVVEALTAGVMPFEQAWTVFITPNSGKVDRDNMNAARKAVRPLAAAFAKTHLLYNPLVAPAMLAQMGFGPKIKPLPGWSTAPILSVAHAVRQVSIKFKGTETGRQGKAAGAQHLELCTKFSSTKPLDVDDYTRMEEATKSPLVTACTEEQRGSCMWFWARWVTNANGKGLWSDMYPVYFT